MIRNRKGEGGFLEAIVALMIVSIALTGFLGLLSYSELGKMDDSVHLDTGFIEELELYDGRITGETDGQMLRFIEKNGLNGAELKVYVAGGLSNASLDNIYGIDDGNNAASFMGTFSIPSDDGRVFVASYEVIYWWD